MSERAPDIGQSLDLLSTSFFDRQVHLYETVIERGDAAGQLDPVAPAEAIARGFVGMEDGLGLQVAIGHSGLDAGEAEGILLAY